MAEVRVERRLDPHEPCRIIGRARQALGHTVRLIPPVCVKPNVKRHKSDAVDAEAICVAVTKANKRFRGIEHGT